MTTKIFTVMAIASATMAGCCSGGNTAETSTDPIITKTDIAVTDGNFTPKVMHQLGKVGDPQLSPDGSKILYGVSYTSIEQNKSNRELYVMNLDGSNNMQVTHTPKSEANARWINDGKQVVFLRGGQLYVADYSNSALTNEKQISTIEGGIDAFELSPNGLKIIYVHNIKAAIKPVDIYPDLPKSSGRTYTNLMYRHWDHFVEEIPHTFVASFDGKSVGEGVDILNAEEVAFELPTLPFSGLEQLTWSPDSKSIAYSCRKLSGKEYAFSTNTDIYLYNVETKECSNLTEGMMGYDTDPVFSPDGKSIAWISMERNGYEADKKRLFVIDLAGGLKKELTTDYKYNVESISWAPASDKIYFSSCVNALTALFEVDVNKTVGKAVEDPTGTGSLPKSYGEGIRRITDSNAWFDFSGVTPIADASGAVKQLIATSQSMMRPSEIVTIDPVTGTSLQLTFENKATLEKLNEPIIEERWMKTVDGKQMHTWIVYPPKFDKTKVYPAILMCLGGPQGTISQGFSTRWNYRLMASQGYIVILPNRRGTTAFGQPWCEQISGDYIGLNMQDYLTSVDNMKKEPYVGKVAATGASYGGYSVYYLAGIHKNRFSALIAHAGIFNQEQMYMMTEEMWFPHWDNGGAPWDTNPIAKRHYDNSPHKLIKNWNTPILVTHGEMDYRVPVEQGMAAFNAAQMMGVESKLLLFPEENHWILKPQNSIHWNREFFAWLDKYCK
ncbi:MAG: S9 family peptidase [Bacteroidales bacterium]